VKNDNTTATSRITIFFPRSLTNFSAKNTKNAIDAASQLVTSVKNAKNTKRIRDIIE
jgi:hypothetical protein